MFVARTYFIWDNGAPFSLNGNGIGRGVFLIVFLIGEQRLMILIWAPPASTTWTIHLPTSLANSSFHTTQVECALTIHTLGQPEMGKPVIGASRMTKIISQV